MRRRWGNGSPADNASNSAIDDTSRSATTTGPAEPVSGATIEDDAAGSILSCYEIAGTSNLP